MKFLCLHPHYGCKVLGSAVCLYVCLSVCISRISPIMQTSQAIQEYCQGQFEEVRHTPTVTHQCPLDRGQWRSTCRTAIAAFEEAHRLPVYRGNHQVVSSTKTAWPCDRCNKVCSSRIMGSSPIVIPIDEAVRRTRRNSPCGYLKNHIISKFQ